MKSLRVTIKLSYPLCKKVKLIPSLLISLLTLFLSLISILVMIIYTEFFHTVSSIMIQFSYSNLGPQECRILSVCIHCILITTTWSQIIAGCVPVYKNHLMFVVSTANTSLKAQIISIIISISENWIPWRTYKS